MADWKLTLVAAFDDLVRNSAVLTTGIEPEFLRFTKHQDECRTKWLEAETEVQGLRDQLRDKQAENNALQTKLKHARGQIDHEIKRRLKAEQDRDSLDRQIMLVRELLTEKDGHKSILTDQDREKLAFLGNYQSINAHRSPRRLSTVEESQSLLSPSDISYDKTEEDLDQPSYLRSGRKWKRPSAPPLEEMDLTPPDKRSRRSGHGHRRSKSSSCVVTTTSLTVQEDGPVSAKSEISSSGKKKKKHRKSDSPRKMRKHHSHKELYHESDDSVNENNSAKPRPGILRESTHGSNYSTPTTNNGSPGLRHYNSAGKGLNRAHIFVQKTVIKPETCIPCGKRIRFGKVAMKCKDCRAASHPECKEQVPLPCVPSTPTANNNRLAGGYISDYVSSDPPMIPAIVIHCVNEVEARGLSEVGIYRVPGSDKEVKDLKEKFLRGKGTPNLSHIDDVNVVAGCVKDFLRGLKDPLVTRQLWSNFVKASEMEDKEEALSACYQAISELPQPNRDTIAFLVLHLQRVSECEECKMPVSNLAKVFGPTIVGYSTAEPEPMQMINETRKQQAVMELLLAVSTDYWMNFINIDTDSVHPREAVTPQTPECRPVPHSMLGPIGTPIVVSRTESTERKGFFGRSTTKFGSRTGDSHVKKTAHFFSSPTLR